jgi:hypothetical protein
MKWIYQPKMRHHKRWRDKTHYIFAVLKQNHILSPFPPESKKEQLIFDEVTYQDHSSQNKLKIGFGAGEGIRTPASTKPTSYLAV